MRVFVGGVWVSRQQCWHFDNADLSNEQHRIMIRNMILANNEFDMDPVTSTKFVLVLMGQYCVLQERYTVTSELSLSISKFKWV